jgi:hypothetical protein
MMAAAVAPQPETFDVGAVRPLFSINPGGLRSFYAVSPDGQRFLVNTLGATSVVAPPITVVVNWLNATKK